MNLKAIVIISLFVTILFAGCLEAPDPWEAPDCPSAGVPTIAKKVEREDEKNHVISELMGKNWTKIRIERVAGDFFTAQSTWVHADCPEVYSGGSGG